MITHTKNLMFSLKDSFRGKTEQQITQVLSTLHPLKIIDLQCSVSPRSENYYGVLLLTLVLSAEYASSQPKQCTIFSEFFSSNSHPPSHHFDANITAFLACVRATHIFNFSSGWSPVGKAIFGVGILHDIVGSGEPVPEIMRSRASRAIGAAKEQFKAVKQVPASPSQATLFRCDPSCCVIRVQAHMDESNYAFFSVTDDGTAAEVNSEQEDFKQ